MAVPYKHAVLYADYSYQQRRYVAGPCTYNVVLDVINGGHLAPVDFIYQTGSLSSVKSPNYWLKKRVRVQWKPLKYNLVRPRKPVLRLPSFPPAPKRKESARKNGGVKYQSASSWNRVNQLYLERVKVVTKRREELAKIFSIRMAKYESRLKKFESQTEAMLHGYLRTRRLRNLKIKPNNPYMRVLITKEPITGQFRQNSCQKWYGQCPSESWIYSQWSGCLEGTFLGNYRNYSADPYSMGNAYASAESRCIGKLYDKLNQWDLHIGNIVAERHQAMKLLKDVVDALTKVNPKNWFKGATIGSVAKGLSDKTLATTFGILPLLQDAHAAGTALAKLTLDDSDRIVVRASSEGTTDVSYKVDMYDGGIKRGHKDVTIKRRTKVSYVLEYEIENANASMLQGFGLVNPAEIAWEMLPFSFVVDWILPVGTFIQSFSSGVGLKFKTGTKVITTTDEAVSDFVLDQPRPSPGYNGSSYYSGAARSTQKTETKTRTVLTTPPSRMLITQFKNPLSSYHVVESLALLTQRYKR